jgi:hypothetical protein
MGEVVVLYHAVVQGNGVLISALVMLTRCSFQIMLGSANKQLLCPSREHLRVAGWHISSLGRNCY